MAEYKIFSGDIMLGKESTLEEAQKIAAYWALSIRNNKQQICNFCGSVPVFPIVVVEYDSKVVVKIEK